MPFVRSEFEERHWLCRTNPKCMLGKLTVNPHYVRIEGDLLKRNLLQNTFN